MPAQRNITVYMRRKPTAAALAAAKAANHAPPPATPLGAFDIPFTTIDGTLAAAKTAAAGRLKVDARVLLANIGPAAGQAYQITVTAPPQES